MVASRTIFFSIFLLFFIFITTDSNAVTGEKSRVRRAFDGMDKGLLANLADFLTTTVELLLDFLECYEQEVKFLDCNFNFTFDPFYAIQQCKLKSKDLKIVADKIEKSIPVMKVNLAVPPVVSKDVCFGGVPPNLRVDSPDHLNAQPVGSLLSSIVGSIGIGVRDVLDPIVSNLYTVLRAVLSFGTAVNVPPK